MSLWEILGQKSESEYFLLVYQDGLIDTLVHRSQFFDLADVSCRTCRQLLETLSACPVYAVSSYIYRHNAALWEFYYHLRHIYDKYSSIYKNHLRVTCSDSLELSKITASDVRCVSFERWRRLRKSVLTFIR